MAIAPFTKKIVGGMLVATSLCSLTALSAIAQNADKIRQLLETRICNNCDLKAADLQGANLRGAELRGADLAGADLREANLRAAELNGADLSGADLRETNFRGAYLEGANLGGASLEGADLIGTNLNYANLGGTFVLRGEESVPCPDTSTCRQWLEQSGQWIPPSK
jgi:uncharacterized protein YjbI with pentapeptide repeats